MKNTKTKILLFIIFLFLYGYGMFLYGRYCGENNFKILAVTDNISSANKIQNKITTFKNPTIRFIDGTKYIIAIRNATESDIDKAAVELAKNEMEYLTDDVSIYTDFYMAKFVSNSANREKLTQNLNKKIAKRLKLLEGIQEAKVDIKIPKNNMHTNNLPTAEIELKTSKDINKKEISDIVKAIISSGIPGFNKNYIKINYI